MRKYALPLLSLTALLTACPQPDPPATYTLTVTLNGLASAPVKITNTGTGTVLFNDTLTTSKTFSNLSAGTVVKVEGQAVNTYIAPASQQVTMTADQTVTLNYLKAPLTSLSGTVRFSLGTPPYQFADSAAANKPLTYNHYSLNQTVITASTTIAPDLSFNLTLPSSAQMEPLLQSVSTLVNQLGSCQVSTQQISDLTARIDGLDSRSSFVVSDTSVTITGNVTVMPWATTGKDQPITLVYADKPLTMSLVAQCPQGNTTVTNTLNLTLNTGWNLVSQRQDASGFTVVSASVDPSALVLSPR